MSSGLELADARELLPELLAELIGFPTVSTESNLELVDWAAAWCERHGARTTRIPDPHAEKANLVVSVGPDLPGGLVWSGHTDVVPVTDQAWTGEPFTMRNESGRLIGRGATDMKGFLACCLALVPWLTTLPLKRPVHLALSYDEELGCRGVGSMAEWLAEPQRAPLLAVIGEPSELRLVGAHKGGLLCWTHVTGVPGHSSRPDRYVNAVMAAGEVISFITGLSREMRVGETHDGFEPPYSTIQVNKIAGGNGLNIIPDSCSFFWETRCIPAVDPESVLERVAEHAAAVAAEMAAIDARAGIELDVMAIVPALDSSASPELVRGLLDHLQQDRALTKASGTEAGVFERAGIPALILGPGQLPSHISPTSSSSSPSSSDAWRSSPGWRASSAFEPRGPAAKACFG